METWALLLFLCTREAQACTTIEFGHYPTKAKCVAVMQQQLEKARKADRGAGAACKLVEEKGNHT